MNKSPENTPGSKLYLIDLADHLFPVPRKNHMSKTGEQAGDPSELKIKPDLRLDEARNESGSLCLGTLK